MCKCRGSIQMVYNDGDYFPTFSDLHAITLCTRRYPRNLSQRQDFGQRHHCCFMGWVLLHPTHVAIAVSTWTFKKTSRSLPSDQRNSVWNTAAFSTLSPHALFFDRASLFSTSMCSAHHHWARLSLYFIKNEFMGLSRARPALQGRIHGPPHCNSPASCLTRLGRSLPRSLGAAFQNSFTLYWPEGTGYT
jgi:hypothetical protein